MERAGSVSAGASAGRGERTEVLVQQATLDDMKRSSDADDVGRLRQAAIKAVCAGFPGDDAYAKGWVAAEAAQRWAPHADQLVDMCDRQIIGLDLFTLARTLAACQHREGNLLREGETTIVFRLPRMCC